MAISKEEILTELRKFVPKHEIRTDYQYTLDKYWEHRFRVKKRQDEWYNLTSADIESFKKRREFISASSFPKSR